MVRKPQNFSLNLIQLIGVLALLVIIAIGFLVIRINLPDVYLYVMGGAALLLPSQLYKTFEPAVRDYLYRKEHKKPSRHRRTAKSGQVQLEETPRTLGEIQVEVATIARIILTVEWFAISGFSLWIVVTTWQFVAILGVPGYGNVLILTYVDTFDLLFLFLAVLTGRRAILEGLGLFRNRKKGRKQ